MARVFPITGVDPQRFVLVLWQRKSGWHAVVTEGEMVQIIVDQDDLCVWTWGFKASSYVVAMQLAAALFGYRGDG